MHIFDPTNFLNLGHERFGGMTRVYYKYAHGALIVFDLARPETFDAALSWLSDVTEKLFDEKNELLAGKWYYFCIYTTVYMFW